MTIQLQKIKDEDFAVYHALYQPENIFLHFDWKQLQDNFMPKDNGYLLLLEGVPIGGAEVRNGYVTAPFLIPPFNDATQFWELLLQKVPKCDHNIFLQYIPETFHSAMEHLGAQRVRTKRQMIRPTARFSSTLDDYFDFAEPRQDEKEEMAEVIYCAHQNGYVGETEGAIDMEQVRQTLESRLNAFSQTGTLDMGNVVKERKTGRMVAVCLTGIYPDSPNFFATIHQVSVLPEYRRRGIAASMIRRAITSASFKSPAIVLGVLQGNPAEKLYSQLGFRGGCAYSDYWVTF